MLTTGISIAALIISLLSLILSFLLSRNLAPYMNSVYIPTLKDTFGLLFDNNNKFHIEIANYNNRDVLVYLEDGYINVDQKKCALKPMYYTLKANAVTTIEVEY